LRYGPQVITQPWWATPFITAVATLGAVAIAQAVVIFLDYVKIKREDARRWHSQRRELYAGLLAAFSRACRYGYENAPDLDWDHFRNMQDDYWFKSYEVSMIASGSVRAAIDRLSRALVEFRDWLDPAEAATTERERMLSEVAGATTALVAAARQDLGVKD
jgi:hypothetical protein